MYTENIQTHLLVIGKKLTCVLWCLDAGIKTVTRETQIIIKIVECYYIPITIHRC